MFKEISVYKKNLSKTQENLFFFSWEIGVIWYFYILRKFL